MKRSNHSSPYIVLLVIVMLMLGVAHPVFAENAEPLRLTVEQDEDCLLSEAGEMTFFRFTLKNTLEEEYTLEEPILQGDLLEEPKYIGEKIIIPANDVVEFTLENVRIEENEFDRDLAFQLLWHTISFDPEDEEKQNPLRTDHSLSATVRVERFVEPVMTISLSPDVLLAREGDSVTVAYTLINDTKFDMTNITLQDPGVPLPSISLEKNVLQAGDRMQAQVTFSMGTSNVELQPSVQYTVRGVESKTSVQEAVTVEYVTVDLRMEVEKYPATSEGTLFRITLTNAGSHPMTDIRLVDEIGSMVANGIALEPNSSQTVSCTIPSAVSAGSIRYVAFEAIGVDCLGGVTTVKSPSAYEVLPFVESDQVRLNLSVTLTGSTQNDDGSNRLKLLFEIHNQSQVPISNAVISESDVFKSVVNEYASLGVGSTTFEKEFIVPVGTRSLTFVLTALDPAQTQYATVPMTLDLSPLMAPKPTSVPEIKPGKTVDVTGTIYDTARYARIIRQAALVVIALTLVFLLLAIIFHVAELSIRSRLPKEAVNRPFGPRKTPTGPIAKEERDPVHAQFGYVQPAKLRYMDRTDRFSMAEAREREPQDVPDMPPVKSGTFPALTASTEAERVPRMETKPITAPFKKAHSRPVMMSSDRTMPFPPVNEEALVGDEPGREESVREITPEMIVIRRESEPEPISPAVPRVIEMKPSPRIIPRKKLEIIHVVQV